MAKKPRSEPHGPVQRPGHELALKDGTRAHIAPNGQLRSVDKNGLHIERNLHGGRTIVSERNGVRVVTTGKQQGSVQRRYVTRGGHTYYARTYYQRGVYRTAVYREYRFGGRPYYAYAPTHYYRPAFYTWAYDPWPSRVYWNVGAWGWQGTGWFAYYGFTPYPYYTGPAFWLTDYVIAANLEAAYANAAAGASTPAPSGLPLRIIENENSADSPTWTFNGIHGIGDFTTGHQRLTIERFQDGNISVRRVDASGFSALYVGHIEGDAVSGTVTYFPLRGGPRVGTWRGTIDSWAPSATQPEGTDAGTPPAGSSDPVTLSADVKQAIEEAVKAQIKAEQEAAAQPRSTGRSDPKVDESRQEVPPALDPAIRTFVVSSDLAVVADGAECSLTQGDIITRIDDTPDEDQKVMVSVTSSKKRDCAPGKTVAVAVDDLQEMHNHLQEQLDEGMKVLAEKQGTGGIPSSPDTTTVAGSIAAPPVDRTAEIAIKQQQAAADQTETQVRQQSGS